MTQEFQFGDFRLDEARYRLQRGERVVHLEKRPMDLLILLVERRGELVSREEIAERLWGKDVFLEVDHGINTAVRKVRQALRDDPEKPRFVETVVGKGYRFAAPVICNNGDQVPQAQPIYSPGRIDPAPTVPSTEKFISSRLWVLLGVTAVLALLAIALVLYRDRSVKRADQSAIRSIAVLPFKNLSGDSTQEYLADGMTEELIGRLSGIRDLKVISRTSVMRFKDTRLSVPEIAKMLGVDAVVEGSVIREDNHIRVHAQLIRAATDDHIWAEEYQREYRSIIALQEEVALTIAGRIKLTITRLGPAVPHVVDPQAYENYLKGRYYSNQRTEEAVKKSILYFQQAISRDPNSALAYSGMADAYALLGFRGSVPSKDTLAQAKSAALKAIELDDTLAEPHASLAFIAETHEWDWASAEREYKRALELNPGDARTHHWYAGYLTYTGKFDQGIAEEKRARELDPLSLPINNALAGRLLVAGRYDEALRQLQGTLEMGPNFPPAHQTMGWVYLNTGKHQEAIREFQRALQLAGSDDTDMMVDLGFAYAAAGDRVEANKILGRLKELHERGLAPSGSVAIVYGALGNLNEAFAWLEKAYEERDPELTYLKVPNRRFGPLRHDVRYQELVRRIGLPR